MLMYYYGDKENIYLTEFYSAFHEEAWSSFLPFFLPVTFFLSFFLLMKKQNRDPLNFFR